MVSLTDKLKKIFPSEKIKSDLINRYAFAADASFYYLLPSLIVQPSSIDEIRGLFLFSQEHAVPLVFRTGGTSLSGQSITDGILVDLSRYWRSCKVESLGRLVRVQPGVIAAHVNHQLKRYGRKIGPDPASINAAMMGGILSNNSSGMCCGVQNNSYHTLQYIKFMLPDGTSYNTELKEDYLKFEKQSVLLFGKLIQLKQQLISNETLVLKIRQKYKLKNTVGYSLNAFLDYEHPLDILAHLLIGAEGTLAFIEEAVLKTLPDNAYKKTGLLYFGNPLTACNAIPALKKSGAESLELMDRAALRSIENLAHAPLLIKQLPNAATAILCEYHACSKELLETKYAEALSFIEPLELLHPPNFTTDTKERYDYWKLRKGMYPSVAAARKKGTTVMLEDIAFPVERLGEGVLDIQQLMQKYGYQNSIIFGHAKEGNLHFVMSQSMNDESSIQQFDFFAKELAELVITKYNGSLKGEHGTGRQIAPFVKDEWGNEAYEIMQELKNSIDPHNMLNPGVILNSDTNCHIKNLKTLPVVEEEVDKCIECGYCENRCPSKDFTLTPRQRIVIRRAVQRLEDEKNDTDKKILLQQYQYAGLDTCAVDGLCATDCPVNINTGDLIKRLRRENHSKNANAIALSIAKNFKKLEQTVKFGLNNGRFVNRLLGDNAMYKFTTGIKKVVPAFPLWMKELTGPVKIKQRENTKPDVIYFMSCITRVMGADKENKKSLTEVVLSVSAKAGYNVVIPNDIGGNCCGQPFSSKGFAEAYKYKANETIEKLWQWTKEGTIPVLMDITSCTQSLHTSRPYLTELNQQKFDKIKIFDSINFIADMLLPKLIIRSQKMDVVLHPVCSVFKMGLYDKLKKIGDACAWQADIPVQAGCCGMAGDRGFYYPGLITSATKNEATEVNEKKYDGYYSSAKTCEMSLSNATGKNYQSLFYLLDEVV
jgi:D-lactate dehydrogenase